MAGQRAQTGVQVTGAVELRRALKKMGGDVKDLTRIHKAAAELVAERARDRAPVKGGKLRSSIRARATRTKANVTAGSGRVPYAGPIHFGWPARNITPQPFLYDALDDRKAQVVATYSQHIGELVERVGRETP